MKRRISLLLAVVMILGSFSFAFAAEESREVKDGAFLKKVGVLEGINGDLKLEDNLRRQDMVFMIARLHGAEEEAKAYSPEGLTFTDFTDPNYRTIIKWAVDKELIEGHTTERFGFNEDTTAQQYATVLLRALDYKEEVADYAKVMELAEKLGLLKDVKVEAEDAITRGQMSVMTFNALGTKMKDSKETLADKLDIEMPDTKPTELKVEKVYTENLAEIRVKLSNAELVKTKDALYNPSNYRLENTDAKVRHIHLEEDELVLTLVPYGKVMDQPKFEVLTKGDVFKLTIRNIDPKINITSGWTEAVDNGIPVVENVDFMGDYGIKVTTSEPIANPEERNFRLDSRTSMFVEQYGKDIILTPYHKGSFDKDATELTIDLLNDFAGYKTVKTIEKMELSTDEDLPKVERAYRSGDKLVVIFDRDVYHKSVSAYESRRDLGNVSFVERRAPFYAKGAVKVDTNVVEYTFEREIPRGIEITVQDVANHFNKAMEKEVIVPDEYKDDFAPVIISSTAVVTATAGEKTRVNNEVKGLTKEQIAKKYNDGIKVDTAKMKIVFDKDVKELVDHKEFMKDKTKGKEINTDDFFTLYELDITNRGRVDAEDVKIKVADVETDTIWLTFEGIKLNNADRDFDYTLEVKNFTDMGRNRMERDYRDFYVDLAGEDFDVKSVKIDKNTYFNRKGIEVVLEFTHYVNKEKAANEENYYLDSKLHVDEAIVERDGKTVSLVVYGYETVEDFLKDYKVLEISPRVVDLSVPARKVKNRYWDLATGKAIKDTIEASDSAITYINEKTPGYVTEVASGEIASTAGVTVEHKTANDFNYKVVAFKGIDQLPAATQEGKGTLTVMLDKLGFTSANIDKEDYKVLVKVYKEETKDKKDYKLVEEKEIYTNDIVAANVSFKTLAGKDAVAGKVSKVTVSTNTGLAVETAEKTAVFNTKTIELVMDSTNSQTEDVVVTDDGSSNYTLTLKSSDGLATTVTLETVVNTINDIKVSGEQVFNATVATANKATAAQAETLTFDNLGETPVVAEPIVLNLESTKAIKPATNISFILDGKTVNAKVEVSTNGKALKVTDMKYAVSGDAVEKADFTGETITEIMGLETVDGVKLSVSVVIA